jgi:hypothetical protein
MDVRGTSTNQNVREQATEDELRELHCRGAKQNCFLQWFEAGILLWFVILIIYVFIRFFKATLNENNPYPNH